MPPKKAEPAVKRGRGRPPKSASTTPAITQTKSAKPRGRPPSTTSPKKSAATPTTPSKRGRPSKDSSTSKAASAKAKTAAAPAPPAKKRGRPAKSTAPASNKEGRPSGRKAPAKIPSARVIKKRGRPAGSTNAKRSATTSKTNKGGRPRGKHSSNLSSNLKTLISSASKGRLVELLSVLCERNAVVARATSNALREEKIRSQEWRAASGEAAADEGLSITVEKHVHITVDEDEQVHTEQGAEPKSGYEADVEPEIPATGTEAGEGEGEGEGGSQEDAIAETETIAQAVSSVRDSAFGL